MCAKNDHVSLICLRIRLTKLSSNSFLLAYPELLIYSQNINEIEEFS